MKKYLCLIFICLLSVARAQVDTLLESDLSALLKSQMKLSKNSVAYYPGTVRWVQDQLAVDAAAEPSWQLPVAGFTSGVFDDKTEAAVKAFQQTLGFAKVTGTVDAECIRALISLVDYSSKRNGMGGLASLGPELALQKNLLWAGVKRFYPSAFLLPIYEAQNISPPLPNGNLLVFSEALATAIKIQEQGEHWPTPYPGLQGYINPSNVEALRVSGNALAMAPTKTALPTNLNKASLAAPIPSAVENPPAKVLSQVPVRKALIPKNTSAANPPPTAPLLKGMSTVNNRGNEKPNVLYFSVGESKPLNVPDTLKTLAIGNNDIADASLISPTQILITTLKVGDTSLTLFFKDGTTEHYILSVQQGFENHRTAVFRLKHLNLQSSVIDSSMSTLTVKPNTNITDPLTKMLTAIIDPTKFSIFPSLGMISVRGNDEEIAKVAAMIQRIDTPIDQLVILTQIIEVNSDEAQSLGFSQAAQSNQMDASFTGSGGGIITFTRGASFTTALVSRLTALVTSGKAKTLANPRILAQSGEVSDIYVGRQIPVVSTDSLGKQTVSQIESGIKLYISPRVNEDKSITTWIATLVSNATTTLYSGLPEIVTRRAETTIRIENGETIVLGGLKSSEYSTTVSKLPFLGDVPILGEIFKSTTASLKESDIIITLTPQILKKS